MFLKFAYLLKFGQLHSQSTIIVLIILESRLALPLSRVIIEFWGFGAILMANKVIKLIYF